MTKIFELTFHGLTGLTPHDDKFLFVLPHLEYGLKDRRLHEAIPSHTAAIIVESDSIKTSASRKPDLTFKSEHGIRPGKSLSLFAFNFERLSLIGPTTESVKNTIREFNPNNPGDCKPLDELDTKGLQWVPSLSLSTQAGQQGVGVFKREAFLHETGIPRKTGDTLGLVGTVLVDSGELFVRGVIKGRIPPNTTVMFPFSVPTKPNQPQWEQAIFDELVWQTKADRVTLRFENSGGVTDEIELDIDPEGCKAWIVNLELPGILGLGSESSSGSADLDSAIFYLFSETVPIGGFPVSHVPMNRGLGGVTVRCRPFRYR